MKKIMKLLLILVALTLHMSIVPRSAPIWEDGPLQRGIAQMTVDAGNPSWVRMVGLSWWDDPASIPYAMRLNAPLHWWTLGSTDVWLPTGAPAFGQLSFPSTAYWNDVIPVWSAQTAAGFPYLVGENRRNRQESTFTTSVSLSMVYLGRTWPVVLDLGTVASRTTVLLKYGDVIRVTVFRSGTTKTTRVFINDVEACPARIGTIGTMFNIRSGTATLDTADPIPVTVEDADVFVGMPADWATGVTATWGGANDLLIPPHGTIDLTSVSEVPDNPTVFTDGTEFERVGVVITNLLIRDSVSLDPGIPEDNSSTAVSRQVFIHSAIPPKLNVHFTTQHQRTGSSPDTVGDPYHENLTDLAAGVEDGWTNRSLDITVDPDEISGNFDTVLRIPGLADLTAADISIGFGGYLTQSESSEGTLVTGFLTQRRVQSKLLSPVITGVVKIDLTEPIPSTIYLGGYAFEDDSYDDLSGVSVVNYPTQIAFAEPDSTIQPDSGWQSLDNHTMATTGEYSVWIRTTDKAGNQATARVYASLYIGGDVSITKDTDAEALLHAVDCPFFARMSISGCGVECRAGQGLEGETAFTYKITMTNTAANDDAVGTFEDLLPEGVTVVNAPTATASGSATVSITSALQESGRYLISGSYSDLTPGETIDISIPSEAPAYDSRPDATNIFRNQMESTWTIGSGVAQINGTTLSNHANHNVITLGVATTFTKVSADDITAGIAEAEFALYRWDGADDPTLEELNHMVDTSDLTDGDWTRVTLHGEDAALASDVFTSALSPLGQVALGNLLDGYYTLIETKAPSGYELPVGQWVLTVDETAADTPGDYKIEFAGKSPTIMPPAAIRETSGGEHSYKIINARPFTIGMSGLSGTQGFLLLGFVLMAVAGNAYLVYNYKQRMKSES